MTGKTFAKIKLTHPGAIFLSAQRSEQRLKAPFQTFEPASGFGFAKFISLNPANSGIFYSPSI